VVSILTSVWEAAGYPWSVRLKALLPLWLPWVRKHFPLTPRLEEQLLQISPRQIDRRLREEKKRAGRRLYGRTKPGSLLKHQVPIKTDRWDVKQPGYSEIDLVSHSGNCATGEFAHTLNVVDIHTTWTESLAVLGKAQVRVQRGLEEIRRALPFELVGIDSDNGSEFINFHLVGYCKAAGIQFTRGRPYKKDDNAHVEQKNWTHVRKLLGWVRYDTDTAVAAINRLYRGDLRLLQNLFLPSVKLIREGGGFENAASLRRGETPLDRVPSASRSGPRSWPDSRRCESGSTLSRSHARWTCSSSGSTPWPTSAAARDWRPGPRKRPAETRLDQGRDLGSLKNGSTRPRAPRARPRSWLLRAARSLDLSRRDPEDPREAPRPLIRLQER
jgi:hypothetical protein